MSEEFVLSPCEVKGSTACLKLQGRLDAEAAQQLRTRCAEVREEGYHRLALELSQVSFIASSGVGTLLALTEEFREVGGTLRLAALSQAVDSVVSLLNLTQYLAIDANLDSACATLEV